MNIVCLFIDLGLLGFLSPLSWSFHYRNRYICFVLTYSYNWEFHFSGICYFSTSKSNICTQIFAFEFASGWPKLKHTCGLALLVPTGLLLFPFYGGGVRGLERASHLPEVTQLKMAQLGFNLGPLTPSPVPVPLLGPPSSQGSGAKERCSQPVRSLTCVLEGPTAHSWCPHPHSAIK